jgi:hypothetical protein
MAHGGMATQLGGRGSATHGGTATLGSDDLRARLEQGRRRCGAVRAAVLCLRMQRWEGATPLGQSEHDGRSDESDFFFQNTINPEIQIHGGKNSEHVRKNPGKFVGSSKSNLEHFLLLQLFSILHKF